ncbi:hypothetical protein HPB48_015332 [Haemaphysalis longicornis]|uniref:Uncharacterized protein n=1 Tax=Haemaphysalis longicornis TaxID=44386 RepID=A0A9J6GYB1_HAELO|nr:hypothetical protein HPB48_015332 [Haemaphysalis longicornis]
MAYVTIKEEEIPPRVPILGGYFTFKYNQLGEAPARLTPVALQEDWLQPQRLPRLPRGQVRVIILPTDGIDVKKMSLYAVMRARTTTAGITEEACKQDLL